MTWFLPFNRFSGEHVKTSQGLSANPDLRGKRKGEAKEGQNGFIDDSFAVPLKKSEDVEPPAIRTDKTVGHKKTKSR